MIPNVRNLQRLHSGYLRGDFTPSFVMRLIDTAIRESGRDEVWIHREPLDALLARAEELERLRERGEEFPPLFGIPFAIKDNIDVAGVPTTAACPAFACTPGRSATVVERLLAAGAIFVGKTNLDQFATGLVGTRSPYGAVRNWCNPEYISGGSSSGSAVAVAAGCVTFALGTDTAGSGRVPAAFQGIVGVKPTRGFLSTRGTVPACRSLDCVSVFASRCEDAMVVARLAASYDEADPFSRDAGDAFEAAMPEQFRFGVPREDQLEFFGDSESTDLYWRAVDQVAAAGGTRVPVDLGPFSAAAELLYGGPWVAERYAAVGQFVEEHPDDVDPTVREIILGGQRYRAHELFQAIARLEELKKQSGRVFRGVDCLLLPTAPTIYTIEEVRANPVELNTRLGIYTNFVNLLDLCAIAMPACLRESNGVPFGVTLVAPAGRDGALCRLAARVLNEPAECGSGIAPMVLESPSRL